METIRDLEALVFDKINSKKFWGSPEELEEVRNHLLDASLDLMVEGLSAEDALKIALLNFGEPTLALREQNYKKGHLSKLLKSTAVFMVIVLFLISGGIVSIYAEGQMHQKKKKIINQNDRQAISKMHR